MSRPWILVTPASRGIGFALTRYLLTRTTMPILATARKDPDGVKARLLDNLDPHPSSSSGPYEQRLTVLPLDVTSESTISSASEQAAKLFPPPTTASGAQGQGQEGYHLHLAFTMPGILRPEKSPRQVDAEEALMTYRVNTLGPLLLMKWFGDFLPRRRTKFLFDASSSPSSSENSSSSSNNSSTAAAPAGSSAKEGRGPSLLDPPTDHAVWMAMSARVGSTSDNRKGGWFSYRSSKAGVNSLVRSFDLQLAARAGGRAVALAYHPGTVRTDLSREYWAAVGEDKLFSPEFAVERMVDVVTRKVGLEGRGRCWDWKGEEILP